MTVDRLIHEYQNLSTEQQAEFEKRFFQLLKFRTELKEHLKTMQSERIPVRSGRKMKTKSKR